MQIRTKRQHNDEEESTVRERSSVLIESPVASTSTSSETPDLDEKLRVLKPDVLDMLKQIGRCDHFVSVLESINIVLGKLDVKNMALHLILFGHLCTWKEKKVRLDMQL